MHTNASDLRFMTTQGMQELACSYAVHPHVIFASSGNTSAAKVKRVPKTAQSYLSVLLGTHVRCSSYLELYENTDLLRDSLEPSIASKEQVFSFIAPRGCVCMCESEHAQ